MLYLTVILQVLAANNVIVPGWLLFGCWGLVVIRFILPILLSLFDSGETGKP